MSTYTIRITDDALDLLQDLVIADIQNFYDDPYGYDSSSSIKEYFYVLKHTCTQLGLDFNMVVKIEATTDEQIRMEQIIKEKK